MARVPGMTRRALLSVTDKSGLAEVAGSLKAHGYELIASGGGVYEIVVDGRLVFSKKSSGRFPDDGEVVRLIEAS